MKWIQICVRYVRDSETEIYGLQHGILKSDLDSQKKNFEDFWYYRKSHKIVSEKYYSFKSSMGWTDFGDINLSPNYIYTIQL